MNFAAVIGVSLRSGYALPPRHPDNGIVTSTGRCSTYRKRNAVQRNQATSEPMTHCPVIHRQVGEAGTSLVSSIGINRGSDPHYRVRPHRTVRAAFLHTAPTLDV